MSTTPESLLKIAEHMFQNGLHDEASWRAATSRAYYAAYHAAYNWHNSLPSIGTNQTGKGSHETLCSQLDNPTVKRTDPHTLEKPNLYWRSKSIGKMLRDSLSNRIVSDYHLGHNYEYAEADETIKYADKILEKTK